MQRLSPWTLVMAVITYAGAHSLEKRSPHYTIETRVIVDSHAFNSWKTRLGSSDADIKTTMEKYVNSTFNDLNSILNGLSQAGINMDARIVSIEFVTENILSSNAGTADSDQVLNTFEQWLSSNIYSSVDHTMLLTGLDLTTGLSNSTAGVSDLAKMCDAQSSLSVVEASPSGAVIVTVVHELGHSMGAEHDGDRNTCTASNHIMASRGDPSKASNQNFRFSACTARFFNNFLASGRASCLTKTTVPKQAASPLGKLYSPDQMCQMVHGKSSYFCRSLYGEGGDAYSSMCVTMRCLRPDGHSCMTVVPADGFVCGKGKRCSLGDCVADSSAPTGSATDICPLGDAPLPVSDLGGQTCSQAIASFPGRCYQDTIRRTCCKSCQAVKTSQESCKYGDQASWCSGLKNYQCYRNSQVCCSTCKKYETDKEDCKYGDQASWCSGLKNYQCYSNSQVCCSTCKKYETGARGEDCKYGDKVEGCATMSTSNCPLNRQRCCDRCK
ncbi:metalloprotease mig-17-like [Littorina saxatilis]|uniref:metalloprotease mig-17-like n=1 Tax=Littorina saxatilis TaxID=31220 RepID=UPI0038B43630